MMQQKEFTVENAIHIFFAFTIVTFVTVTGFSSSNPSSYFCNKKATNYLHRQTCYSKQLSKIEQDDKIVELKEIDITNTFFGLSTEQKIRSLVDESIVLYTQAKQSSSLLQEPLEYSNNNHIDDWNTEIETNIIHLREQEIQTLVEDCSKTLYDYRQFEQDGEYTKKNGKEDNTSSNSHDTDFNDNCGEGTSKCTGSGNNTINNIDDNVDDLADIASELNQAIIEAVNSNAMNEGNIVELAKKYILASSSSSSTASLSVSEAEILANNRNDDLGDNYKKKETNSGSSNSIIYNDYHKEDEGDEGDFELQICRLRSRLEQIKVISADASLFTNGKDVNEYLTVVGSLLSNIKTKKIPNHGGNANDDDVTAVYGTTKTTIPGATETGTNPTLKNTKENPEISVVTFSDKKQQFSNDKEKATMNVGDEEKAMFNGDNKEKIKLNGNDEEKVALSGIDNEKVILNGISIVENETPEKLTSRGTIKANNGRSENLSVDDEGDNHHSSELPLKKVMGVLATGEAESTNLATERITTSSSQPLQSKEQRNQLVHRNESIAELNENTTNMESLIVSTLPIKSSLSDGMFPSSLSSSIFLNGIDVVANIETDDDIKDVSSVSSNNTSAMEDDEETTKIVTAVIAIFVAATACLQTFLQSGQCSFLFCEEVTKLF